MYATSTIRFNVLFILLIPASLPMLGCSADAPNGPGDNDAEGIVAENGLVVDMGDGTSNTIGTIRQTDGKLSLTLYGEQSDDGGDLSLTSLSGTSEEDFQFSALLSDDVPSLVSTDFGQFMLQESTGDTLVYTFTDAGASARTLLEVAVTLRNLVDQDPIVKMIGEARNQCEESFPDCSKEVHRDLSVVLTLVVFRTWLDKFFDYYCIEEDVLEGADCFNFLAIEDTIGQTINAIVDANPDLPPSIRALCYNLSGECDTDDGDLQSTMHISGATEICINQATQYSVVTGSGIESGYLYFWAVADGEAQMDEGSGEPTRTITATEAGRITLVVEVRDPTTTKKVASIESTIQAKDCDNDSADDAPDDSTTDSTADLSNLDGCWTVTQTEDTSGTSFEQIWQVENQQLVKLWGENSAGLIIEAVRFTSPNADSYHLENVSQTITPGTDPGSFSVEFAYSTWGTLEGQTLDTSARSVEMTDGILADVQTFTASFHDTGHAPMLSEDGFDGYQEYDRQGIVLGTALTCPDASQEGVYSEEEYAEALNTLTSGKAAN